MTEIVDVIQNIKTVLNDNLTDMWEVATGNARVTHVFSNDFRLTGTFPKVQILLESDDPSKKQWGNRTNYLESNMVHANIFYYNKPLFKYVASGSLTYEDGGSNDNPSLNRYMLEQIRETLVTATGNGSLTTLNNLRFGSIISTQLDKGNSIYYGYVPITFIINKRLGT